MKEFRWCPPKHHDRSTSAGGDAEGGRLDQRDGDAELDRGHARDKHDGGEERGELNRLHVLTSSSRLLDAR